VVWLKLPNVKTILVSKRRQLIISLPLKQMHLKDVNTSTTGVNVPNSSVDFDLDWSCRWVAPVQTPVEKRHHRSRLLATLPQLRVKKVMFNPIYS
jgi:hypothetical protein